MNPVRSALLAAALVGAGAASADCGATLDAATRRLVQGQGWTVAYAPSPTPEPVARHFALEIEACAADGGKPPAALAVDADMPAHRHGMNYRVRMEPQGPGRWRAAALMFHMPGRWRYLFDITAADGRRQRLTAEVEVQ